MSVQSIGTILGVLGFFISVYNFVSTIRHRTVNDQPQLVAELRGYIETAHNASQQLRPTLNFDRYAIHTGQRPHIPAPPPTYGEAIARMPELGATVTAISQRDVVLMHGLIKTSYDDWITLNNCLISDPINENALEFSGKLNRKCLIIEKFFPDYVTALTAINKGNIWKRYRYRDHAQFTYRLFGWKPLARAVSEYEQSLGR